MPTWSGVLGELRPSFDDVRRGYIKKLHEKTGRNVILYASAWLQKNSPSSLDSVTEEDIQGLMEVVNGLPKNPLDLILHSPGGSPVAAEGIVKYLHEQFPYIRVVVPQLAMSAATMIACGGHSIVMGKHSALGPIDPQIYVSHSNSFEPAQTIIDQFDFIIRQSSNPGRESLASMLALYGPSLIVQCFNLIHMSKSMVQDWLSKWMFGSDSDGSHKAEIIAEYLGNHGEFFTHSRHVTREMAIEKGLKVEKMEDNAEYQDLVLSVFHATTHTFGGTKAVKIIENHNEKAFIKFN